MKSMHLIIATAFGAAALSGLPQAARADGSVTVLGTTAFAACAAAAKNAKRTASGTRADLAACDKAVRIWPALPSDVAIAFVNRSVIDLARDESAQAITDASAAIRIDPALAEAHLDRGIALSSERRLAEAIDDFTRAIDLNLPHPEIAYFDRAMAREDSGNITQAYFDYRQAVSLNPNWEKPRAELARFTVVHTTAS